ncbi:hypothetical protein HJB90_29985 [Rhizobium sp. NLR10a]|uniref:hypothetical protein n=1 Tax=unclassified Rhizobium TaxID=2613769 RepID=UPI001C83E1F9|nr:MULTISPECIES: hypothetical protein [unclassified Rhizobium]MBX5279152.1 hypothetical protein [Rhizobium sp. NLR13a]MBX5285202.1 hypothetical protein [Rhizobium sp. NLR10a]MBX5293075.1 hypothetical protein [Rhizobium sp. NLR15a]
MFTLDSMTARLRRSATVPALCAGLLLNPLAAGVAFADTKTAIDKLLGEAIVQAQTMVGMMTNNCSGDAHGDPPEAYEAFVKKSNEVNKQLGDLRVALAGGKSPNSGQQIDAVQEGLRTMVNMMHENCHGGDHGVNPQNYGGLIQVQQNVSGKLDAVKTILEAV